VKFFAFSVIVLSAGTALAQQAGTTAAANPDNPGNPNPIVTLASQFFENDFFNVFGYADGVYDSYAPRLGANSPAANGGGFGWDAGGGASGYHRFREGEISFSYRGDYRDYRSLFSGNGTDQSLGLSYVKRLNRRWTFSLSASAGIYLYGNTFSTAPTITPVQPNPFSPETRFLSSGVTLTYRQTRRLSYTFSGAYSLQRYNLAGFYGLNGEVGSGSVQYRLTARTTLGGTYSYNYFEYQNHAGRDSANNVGATLSHQFQSHWSVDLYAGVTRSNATGVVTIPVNAMIGNQIVTGYATGQYRQISDFPSVTGTVTHTFRRFQVQASGGQGLSGGNGYYLASKDLFFNGVLSRSTGRRAVFSLYASDSRLSSIANKVSSSYSYNSFGASYAVSLMRYVGANFSYSYIRYGTLSSYSGISDNRLAFGITFSSKSIPITPF
jgi:hypothetical protein